MNSEEKYQFDLAGYLLVKGMLEPDAVARCLAAADALEERIVSTVDTEPHFIGHFGIRYHYDQELGICSYKINYYEGLQYIADDFLNADPAFDVFVNHARTMAYVRELTMGPIRINGSELRYRHRGNYTGTHMGGPIDARNEYRFLGKRMLDADTRIDWRDFEMLNVRVLYALHDLPEENGPLCVVPGSHKANFHSPYGTDPRGEPGMVVLPMKAGDALFFTENLRHGGFPNVSSRVRKTVHLCFAPAWVASQSPAHWNGLVHVTGSTWARYNDDQRALLPPPSSWREHGFNPEMSDELLQTIQRLQQEIDFLTKRNEWIESLKRKLGPLRPFVKRLLG
jgi:hypothetical protein